MIFAVEFVATFCTGLQEREMKPERVQRGVRQAGFEDLPSTH